jgi:uncharacterized phage-like protein YoqJ
MIVAATGHRPRSKNTVKIPMSDTELDVPDWDGTGLYSEAIRYWMRQKIESLKATTAVSGMALGVDMLWAEEALKVGLLVVAAVPCDNQERSWPQPSQERYHRILSHKMTTTHVICPGPYATWKMQARNAWMVDQCEALLAVWDGTPGGTSNCVRYAQDTARKWVIRLNPHEDINIGQTKRRLTLEKKAAEKQQKESADE